MTCAKQKVICVITMEGGGFVVGEISCDSPQKECPRSGMKTGEGYELCASVCKQHGHAEAVAASMIPDGMKGATAYLFGHTYACDACKSELRRVGVKDIVIGG